MTRLVALAGACVLAVVAAGPAHAQKSASDSSAADLATKAKEMAADLKEARELLKSIADKTTRDRLELLITRSELKAAELEKALAGVVPTGAAPLSAEEFARLMKSLKAEAFDEGKAGFVALFAQGKARLTCEQAQQILKAFSFDEDRVKCAVQLYPRVTDPENFFKVLDTFSFSSSRDEVRKQITSQKGK
jgi:hypothetical protein